MGRDGPAAEEGGGAVRLAVDGAIAEIALDHPPLNLVTRAMLRALDDAIRAVAAQAGVRCAILHGGGARAFCAGSDMREFEGLRHDASERKILFEDKVLRELARLPMPTIAAIDAPALGGGFELALACGMIIADSRTVFAFPEIKLGSIAPYGTVLAAMRLPRSLVEELLLTGKELNAGEARQWGLVNRVVAAGAIENAVFELAQTQIMPYSAATLRIAAKSLRQQYLEPGLSLSDRLTAMERVYIDELVPLEDAREGIRAFLEQRYPGWRNR